MKFKYDYMTYRSKTTGTSVVIGHTFSEDPGTSKCRVALESYT